MAFLYRTFNTKAACPLSDIVLILGKGHFDPFFILWAIGHQQMWYFWGLQYVLNSWLGPSESLRVRSHLIPGIYWAIVCSHTLDCNSWRVWNEILSRCSSGREGNLGEFVLLLFLPPSSPLMSLTISTEKLKDLNGKKEDHSL